MKAAGPQDRFVVRRLGLGVLCATALALAAPAGASAASLSVSVSGAGSGTVTSKPGTVNCVSTAGTPSGTCFDGTLPANTDITMTAVEEPGSVFAGWTVGAGGCTGLTNPCQFKTDLFGSGSTSLTAQFIVAPDPVVVHTGEIEPGPNDLLLKLNGAVNPEGFAVSQCRFEYDTREYEPGEGPHGTVVPCTPSAAALGEGSADVAVSGLVELEQLTPETTYHYRLLAANLSGTREGQMRTFATGAAPPDSCANAALRKIQPFGAIALPGCMALEMVSPAQKRSQLARTASISVDGERVWFKSTGALEGTPAFLNPLASYYVASRTAEGWQTAPTAGSGLLVNGAKEFGQPLTFSPDFAHWLTINSTQEQFPQGISRAYSDGLATPFEPISPLLVPVTDSDVNHNVVWRTTFKGASADLSRLYLSPGAALDSSDVSYFPEDPEPRGAGGDPHVYVAGLNVGGEPSLTLLAREGSKVWGNRCGARVGGAGRSTAPTGRNQGAISPDGSLVYFSTRPSQPEGDICRAAENPLRIMARSESGGSVEIEELFAPECSPCSSAKGDDFYEGGSADQTKIYLTTDRQLTDSDADGAAGGADLYLYDPPRPGGKLVQVSEGEPGSPTPGAGAEVQRGTTAISVDGSNVYFVAKGILTNDPNPSGQTASEGQPNLYRWNEASGDTAFVGTLAAADEGSLWGRAGSFVNDAWPVPAKGTGDGHILLFNTKAALIASDADGGRRDTYRYDGSGAESLQCLSCAPGNGAFDVNSRNRGSELGVANETGTDLTETARWASEDGGSIVFATAEALVPGDANGAADSYLWRDGALLRLPGIASASGPVVSADGEEVAFASFAPLLPFDRDTALDIYVARAGGGFAPPTPAAAPCLSKEECRPDRAPAPLVVGTPSTNTTPEANTPFKPKRCPKGKRKVRRKGKALCVKRARKGKRTTRKQRRHNTNGRAGK